MAANIIRFLIPFASHLPPVPMKKTSLLTAVAVMFVSSIQSFAQINLITDRAAFPTFDTLSWIPLGPPFTLLSSTFTATTVGGNAVTVSHPEDAFFERRDQDTGWGGNFFAGDILLWNGGDNGPITFDPASLISGAGFNVQSDYPGPFIFRLDAYDSGGGLLGSVTHNGISDSNVGTAIFIGFTSASANVDKFVATLVEATAGPSDFAINALALAGPGGGLPTMPVPESSTYGIFAAALALAIVVRNRTRRAVQL